MIYKEMERFDDEETVIVRQGVGSCEIAVTHNETGSADVIEMSDYAFLMLMEIFNSWDDE